MFNPSGNFPRKRNSWHCFSEALIGQQMKGIITKHHQLGTKTPEKTEEDPLTPKTFF